MNLLIREVRLINPGKSPVNCDIAIADGVISRIGKLDGLPAEVIIEGGGNIAVPGLVDLAARLREPGATHKGSILTETKAAAAGGITTLCLPPDTSPVIDNPAVIDLINQRNNEAGFTRVLPLAAMTAGLDGKTLGAMGVMKKEGAVGVSNALHPFASSHILRQGLKYAATLNMTAHLHPFDFSLSSGGVAHEGKISTRLGLPAIPAVAETLALGKILTLAEELKAQVHICRISSARSVEMIADAKQRGVGVSCDTAIHQLFYTEDNLRGFDPSYHVLPPFREEHDRRSLRQAVLNGVIDGICSDHQPHDPDAKNAPFPATEPGISSLDGFVPMLVKFCAEENIGLEKILNTVTAGPAAILNRDLGVIREGKTADLAILDGEKKWRMEHKKMMSHGKNSPLAGSRQRGKVKLTIVNGAIVYRAE